MKGLIVGLAALITLPSAANAAAFMNGDFEVGTNPGSKYITLDTSGGVDGWTITSGTIDYIGGYWAAGSGIRSIDLNGNSAATISQTFDTVAGLVYSVGFLLAGNTDGGPALKTLEVSATGNAAQQFSFDTTGYSRANMGWTDFTYVFTAAGASTTLSFASLTAGDFFGPVLDGVTVTAVPEPATWAMLFGGFALIGGAMRRRQQVVQFS